MKETYYFPVYCYRHWPSLADGINEIIRQLGDAHWLEVYTSIEDAEAAGNRMLCDDDCFGIMHIDFDNGMAELFFESDKTSIHLPALSKNHLKIISNVKIPKQAKYLLRDEQPIYPIAAVHFDTDLVTLWERDQGRVYNTVDVRHVEFDFTDFTEAEQKAFLNKFERYREYEEN